MKSEFSRRKLMQALSAAAVVARATSLRLRFCGAASFLAAALGSEHTKNLSGRRAEPGRRGYAPAEASGCGLFPWRRSQDSLGRGRHPKPH